MSDRMFGALHKEFPDIQKGVLLKKYTTFNIGGPAEYFLPATTQAEILRSIAVARELSIPIFIMGGGSNLLVSDQGVKGLVVKNQVAEPMVLRQHTVVEAPAGVTLGTLVDFSIENSLEGLEWAGGLPGTFGGAVRGNAGAFGGEIKDSVLQVTALDDSYNLREFSNAECQFSYRSSLFKEKNWVVLSALLQLKKGERAKLREIADSRIAYRKEKHPLEYPNAGSVFKNVDFKKVPPQFQERFYDKVKQDPFPIVPSAWFIIEAGLTGTTVGQAQISKKHSNYIVNLGGARADDVVNLMRLTQECVKEAFNIELEPEIQLLGF